MKYEETRLSGWILTIRRRSLITKKAWPQFFWTGTLVLRRVLENTVEIRARKLQANWKWSYVVTKEENVVIFRRYIAEISCIEGFPHDISWRNIGPTIFQYLSREIANFSRYRWFGDKSTIFFRYIAWSTRVNESQTRYSARHRATVLLQCLSICLLPRGFEPQTFTRLPPGLTCPLIHNMQQIYIYLNSYIKKI